MHGRKHIHRVAALLTAVAAFAFVAGSVQAADSRPVGMTKAQYRAQMLRSEAMDVRYGLGGPQKLRSEAMDVRYGLGVARIVPSTPAAVTVTENGFVWGDFAIGAAAMLGVILVAGGLAVVIRRRASEQTSFPGTI
jgi:hypothetical protein